MSDIVNADSSNAPRDVQSHLDQVADEALEETVGLVTPVSRKASFDTTPRTIGDYELLAEIARGGMGVVYKARQTSLKRVVALKMILAGDFASPADIQRFHTEAESAAQLDHPHIVPVFEVGEHQGRHFFSMGFVEGASLAARLSEGPLAASEAVELVRAVAAAVGYAHEKGVIHRDLKPGNILIDKSGQPRVTDFGLAKRTEAGASDLTGSGQILGTPSYMPPEQALGQPQLVRESADIYALGAVLYAILTGRPPFQADNPLSTLKMVLERDPVRPRQLNASIPVDLETICLKCLEKNPDRRYARALDLADELGRFVDGRNILARPVSALNRGWRWTRRNPVVASLAGSLLLLVLGTAIGSTIAAFYMRDLAGKESLAKRNETTAKEEAQAREKEERKAKRQAEESAAAERIATNKAQNSAKSEREAKEEAQARRDELRRQLSRQYVRQGTDALKRRDNFASLFWYVKALELDEGDPAREPAHRLRIGLLLRHSPRLIGLYPHDGPLSSAEPSHDGKRVVTAGYDGQVKVWDIATNQQIGQTIRHEKIVYHACFSPDDQLIATGSEDRTARVWKAETGEPFTPPLVHGDLVNEVAFSPDGLQLATATHSPRFFHAAPAGVVIPSPAENPADPTKPMGCIWNIASATPTPLYGLRDSVHSAQFTPDGERLVTLSPASKRVYVFNAKSGELVVGPLQLESSPQRMAISLDSKTVIVSGMSTTSAWDIRLGVDLKYPANDPKFLEMAGPNAGNVWTTWRQDDLAVKWTGQVRLHPGDRPISPILPAPHDGTRLPRFVSPQRLVFAGTDGLGRLWDLAPQATRHAPLPHTHAVNRVAYRAGGRQLLTCDDAGQIAVWNCDTGEPLSVMGHSHAVRQLTQSSDETLIVSAGYGRVVNFWQSDTGLPVGEPIELAGPPWSMGLSSDGQTLVVAHAKNPLDRAYPEFTVFDVATRQARYPAFAHGYNSTLQAISGDSRYLATCGPPNHIAVRDLTTGKIVHGALQCAFGVLAIAFSPDSRTLAAAGGDGLLRVFELNSGRELMFMHLGGRARALAFDLAGTRIAAGSSRVRIFDSRLGKPLTPWMEVGGSVETLRFTPDGSYLVSGSVGGEVSLWDASTGEQMGPPFRHTKAITDLAIRPDGRQLATASEDETARLWDLEPEDRPLVDLQQLSALLYPNSNDATGAIEPLDAREVLTAYEQVAAKHPHETRCSSEQERQWKREFAAGENLKSSPKFCLQLLDELGPRGERDLAWHRARIRIAKQLSSNSRLDQELATAAKLGIPDQQILETLFARANELAPVGNQMEIDQLLAGDPNNTVLLYQRGLLHYRNKRWQAVADDATQAIAKLPIAHFFALRAEAYLGQGDFEGADSDLRRMLKRRCREEVALLGLMHNRVRAGDKAGVEDLRKLLAARPTTELNYTFAWLGAFAVAPTIPPPQALAYVEERRKNGKKQYLDFALHGALLMRAGRHDEARVHLLEATRSNFTNPTAWLYLTLSYAHAGKLDEARTTFSQAQMLVRLHRQSPSSTFTWHDTRQWELLIKEAEARLPPAKDMP